MDSQTERKIEETVLEILRNSNMDEVAEDTVRKSASEKLELNLSEPIRKKFVRQVVELYLPNNNPRRRRQSNTINMKERTRKKNKLVTADQWAYFSKNVPAIEKAIKKMESRLN